jgi:uncharacterized protein involved in exopolysaccharide biosynthesis
METPNPGSTPSTTAPAAGARLFYLMSPDAAVPGAPSDEMDLVRLWNTLWRSRWLIVAITAAFGLGSAVYASLQERVYTASVVLAPVKEESLGSLVGQLGGLASLAGLATRPTEGVEAIAVLKSRDFARGFIEDQALLPVLYADKWDAAAARWKVMPPPTPVQGARFFVANVLRIDEDTRTGLVTVSINWRDPQLATAWANLLAMRVNDRMRQHALEQAEANVKYLREEFETTSIVALQQSIGRLLESEMQKLMLARGNAEFSFRVIDRAEVPSGPSKPRWTLIVILGTFFGAMLSAFVVFVRDMVRSRSPAAPLTAGGSADRTR